MLFPISCRSPSLQHRSHPLNNDDDDNDDDDDGDNDYDDDGGDDKDDDENEQKHATTMTFESKFTNLRDCTW